MTARLVWDKGGEATIVALDAQAASDVVRLVSTVPSPPGSRVGGSVMGEDGAKHVVRIKVHGSKKREDGAFDLEGRMIDLRRETREIIQRLV
jgi:hypothetical protein